MADAWKDSPICFDCKHYEAWHHDKTGNCHYYHGAIPCDCIQFKLNRVDSR